MTDGYAHSKMREVANYWGEDMRSVVRLLAAASILAIAVIFPYQAHAAGIRCFAEQKFGPDQGMICSITCVICEDQDNNNAVVGQSCYDNVCWFGKPEN